MYVMHYRPFLLPLGGQLRVLVSKVKPGHDSIVRWASRLFGGGFHVSPVSSTWLRSHEADYNKHGADV